jgi:histidine kinase
LNAINWRRAATYGVIWGLAVAATESLAMPLGDLTVAELLLFEARLMPHLILSGIVLASLTMLLHERLSLKGAAIFLLLFSLFSCLMVLVIGQVPLGIGVSQWWGTEALPLHTFWRSFSHGGVFFAAYRFSVRSERTRALLMRAEIAREQSEAALSAAQLQALQGQVDPAFLIRTLVEVERRYSVDAAGADRLLHTLVSFLRTAMPAVRSGASTLAAEVALATDYSRLCSELDEEGPAWRIEVEGSLPEVDFPPLLLLPVLDQLSSGAGPACRGELRVNQSPGRCTLTLHTAVGYCPGWLPPDLLYRFQVGLRALFNDDWTLGVGNGPASPAFMLTIPLQQPLPVLVPTPMEVSYG